MALGMLDWTLDVFMEERALKHVDMSEPDLETLREMHISDTCEQCGEVDTRQVSSNPLTC